VNSLSELHRQKKLTIFFGLMTLSQIQQKVLERINRLLSIQYILRFQYDTDDIETTDSSSFSVVASVFVAAGKFSPGSCLAMVVYSGSTSSAVGGLHRHTESKFNS
jgi:hypothetical protein